MIGEMIEVLIHQWKKKLSTSLRKNKFLCDLLVSYLINFIFVCYVEIKKLYSHYPNYSKYFYKNILNINILNILQCVCLV